MVSYKIIGKHIREARHRLGLSQEDAAFRANMSQPYFGKYERGDIRQNIDKLADISQALEIPFISLFEGAFIPDGALNNRPVPAEEYEVFMNELGSLTDERTKLVLMRLCADVRSLLAKPEDKAE